MAVRDTKENASEQESVIDFVVTEKRLWELHRIINNRKGSISSTYEKKRRGEQEGVRLEPENGGSVGSSGRGVRDVRGHVGHRGKRGRRTVICFGGRRGGLSWRRHGSTRTTLWKCWKIVAAEEVLNNGVESRHSPQSHCGGHSRTYVWRP